MIILNNKQFSPGKIVLVNYHMEGYNTIIPKISLHFKNEASALFDFVKLAFHSGPATNA